MRVCGAFFSLTVGLLFFGFTAGQRLGFLTIDV